MPKITYVPSDRWDPMYSEAPTRYSPRPLPKSERAQAVPDKNIDAPSHAAAVFPVESDIDPTVVRHAEVVPEGAIGDVMALARQLFQWARRDPKLKIIPAVERELVIQALKETEGNQVHAAKLLGITRATLRKRVEKFGIQRELSIK